MSWNVESAAAELLSCERDRRDRLSFSAEWPELDVLTGYRVQDLTLRERIARGESVIGIKLGLTSKAKQQRMGVDSPFVAWLTDAMLLEQHAPVPLDKLIHPRVEPEIVFVMGDRLEGPGVTAGQALAAVDSVLAGAEVIDSRYTDFKFTAGDVVADNASSGFFALGPISKRTQELDLAKEVVLVEVDGERVDRASGSAVLGHPAKALALAANELAARGHSIEAGWIVLTGGVTDAYPLNAGSEITVSFDNLGAITVAAQESEREGTF